MDLHQISKRLKEFDGARVTERELRGYVSVQDYDEYYHIVIELVNNNMISPVKSSGSNGMHPPLHKRYTIIKPECKYDELIPEIRLLHNRLNIEGYLSDTGKYKNHKHWLSYLDYFLKNKGRSLEIPLSINERSFQIFKKEKVLKEDNELAIVLNFNQGLREALNCYNTPEPFFTYHIRPWEAEGKQELHEIEQELNILIIENKDTWYTLRSRLSPCRSCIAGIHFDSLIYGEGKKISRKIDSLTEFDQSFFKNAKTNYYYFGDLDYEGVGIIHDLIHVNPMLHIKLMKPLYIAMLKAAENIPLPVTKGKQNKKAAGWFVSLFDTEQKSRMKDILESGRYIPQEILNNGDFIGMIDGDNDSAGDSDGAGDDGEGEEHV